MKLTIIAFFGVLVAGFLTSLAYAEELGNKNTHTTKCECSYGEWTESACIATNGACGSGQKTKTRQCVCPSNYKGKPDCPSGSDETVTISCTASCCSWVPSDWTDCKNGYQTQNYSCVCQPGAPADSKCSDSAPSSQTRPCCSWGDWTNYQNCSVNCGGGQSIRYRPCVCGTGDLTPVPQPPKDCKSGGYDSHYKPPSSSTPIANYCDGSAMESVPCNNFSCCTWGNYSEWSDCVNCGKNRTRYAICNCTNPLTYTSLLCPLQNSSFDSMLNMTLFCEGPQPMESAPCPDCNTTTTSNCTFDNWSNWTQCSSFCGGFQYRRQLCTCPEDDNSTCTEDYTDSRCVGIPQTETRPCNISCCSWVWTENWSQCNMENHCCGNGTQWRRPVCQCDGNIADDSSCSYAGVPPLNETRVCSSKPCCQLGPLQPINCSLLAINSQNMPDYCITPWSERYCQCPDATGNNYTTANFSQCNVDYSRIPISYNRSSDLCGDPAAYPTGSITCSQYNSTAQCISWQIDFDQTTGDLLQIHDANTTAIGECLYSTEYCWDGWTDWSECCGSCSSSTQWRRQTSSGTYSTCSVPPAYEVRACNLTGPCCEWVYDDSKQWSNCSVLCGNGEQWRFPYNCSCGNSSLCPTPPPLEVHSCTVDCCTFVDSVDSTQCDADNCQSWSSQQCFCGDMANSTSGFVGLAPACDLSDCYGVPNENLTDCPGCTPQSDIPLPWQTQPEPQPLPWESEPEPQPQPPTCAWRFLSTSDCSGSCDSVVVLNPTPSNQTTSSVVAAGVQVTTRACFCGNQQVAPGNCPNDYTVFTKQTCSIACTCSWVNATSWSTCNSGKRYYTRKCNCSDLICPNTSSSTSSSKRNYGKDKDDQKSNYGKDKDHQNYGKDNDDHKSTYGKDKDNQKPTSSNPPSSLPQSTYSFACGGYDVVIEDCSSSAPPTDIRNNPTDCDDASSSHSKTSKKHKREVKEEFLGEKESDDLQKNPEAPSLLVVIIPVVVVSILVTAAAILIIIKSRNDNRS